MKKGLISVFPFLCVFLTECMGGTYLLCEWTFSYKFIWEPWCCWVQNALCGIFSVRFVFCNHTHILLHTTRWTPNSFVFCFSSFVLSFLSSCFCFMLFLPFFLICDSILFVSFDKQFLVLFLIFFFFCLVIIYGSCSWLVIVGYVFSYKFLITKKNFFLLFLFLFLFMDVC
jgi:hypothetical protein